MLIEWRTTDDILPLLFKLILSFYSEHFIVTINITEEKNPRVPFHQPFLPSPPNPLGSSWVPLCLDEL